jgi:hypothetical protein
MSDVTITVIEDGPYVVEGDVSITDEDGRELDLPYDVELCRWHEDHRSGGVG